MKLLIHNAHIISPDIEIEQGALEIEEGKIIAVNKAGDHSLEADEVIDAGGRYVMPGFIDIHAHGANGKDVCDNSEESINAIAMQKLREGVTTWLPTTLTQPQELLREIVTKCARYMSAQNYVKTPGLHIEGPFINPLNAGAQNPDFVREPDWDELKRIHEIAPVSILSIAPDVKGAVDCIKSASDAGILCSAAHSSATHAEMMLAKEAGLSQLTHFGNAMSGLHHREIGMIGSGLLDHELKVELICDGIHLCPDFVKLVFEIKSMDQIILITDSMSGSWIESGEVQLGGLDVIVNQGEARLKDSGALAGSILRYNEGLRHVHEWTGLPLDQLVKTTSLNQAESLGIDGVGKIEVGYHADIAILEKDFSVWKTLVDGEVR